MNGTYRAAPDIEPHWHISVTVPGSAGPTWHEVRKVVTTEQHVYFHDRDDTLLGVAAVTDQVRCLTSEEWIASRA
ncbi:hypothetical protein [Nonomuraea sp. KM90]|uniref:hypothetical protein n=1 Tax=Nonomuraea sp. KM90 TaxID=3457428 RepID=UPI003FCEDF38